MKRYLALGVLLVSLCLIYYYYDPSQYIMMPKCSFKLLTGYDCPGCGFQRAFHSMLSGHFIQAIQYNYFLVYSVPYALLLIFERFILLECELRSKIRHLAEHRVAVHLYIALYILWFIVRNILNI